MIFVFKGIDNIKHAEGRSTLLQKTVEYKHNDRVYLKVAGVIYDFDPIKTDLLSRVLTNYLEGTFMFEEGLKNFFENSERYKNSLSMPVARQKTIFFDSDKFIEMCKDEGIIKNDNSTYEFDKKNSNFETFHFVYKKTNEHGKHGVIDFCFKTPKTIVPCVFDKIVEKKVFVPAEDGAVSEKDAYVCYKAADDRIKKYALYKDGRQIFNKKDKDFSK